MNHIFALSKVMLKTSLVGFGVSKKKWLNILFGIFILLFAIVPIVFVFTFMFSESLRQLVAVNQEALLINLILALITIVVFIFSFLHIPSVYYFANDVETYLALPLKPYEILISKFLVVLVYEYAIVLILFIPFLVTFINATGNYAAIFFGLIVALLIPIVPVLLASLVIILLMNFVPFFKNKNTLNLLIGLISIAAAIGINVVMQSAQFDQAQLIDMIQKGNNSISNAVFAFLPSVRYASSAIANSSFLNLILFIAITLLLFVLYIFFAQSFYLNGATSISDAARSKKRFDTQQLSNAKNQSITKLFAFREIKNLIRVPSYLLNGILPIVIFPIILLVLPFLNSGLQDADVTALLGFVEQFLGDNSNLFFIAVLTGLILGLFISATNMTGVTSITREAKVINHIKTYPIDFFKMILGKLLVSISLTSLGLLLTLMSLTFLMPISWQFILIAFVSGVLVSLLVNLFGIIRDLHKPNLKWTNEVQSIKQGFNVFLISIGSFVLMFFIGILAFVLFNQKIVFVALSLGLVIITNLALFYYLKTHTQDLFLNIDN